MTVSDVDLSTPVAPPVQDVASWGRRVVAALLDAAVLGAVAWLVGGDRIAAPSLQPTFDSGSDPDLLPWTSSGAVVTAVVLMLVLQGLTGQTPGRRVVGIQVVRAPADGPVGGPPGVLRSVVRCWAHLLDAILLIGYLRPLWHPEGRTFADGLLGTVVVHRRPRADGRGRVVTVAAWIVVVLGIVLGVRVGDAGGVTPQAAAECALATQGTEGPSVESVSLVRGEQWRESRNLWPWFRGDRQVERELTTLEVAWDAVEVEPEVPLVVRTTVDGVTVVHDVPAGDGAASLSLEDVTASPVDVEVWWQARLLTSCTATPPVGD